jgi:hypothetical protein
MLAGRSRGCEAGGGASEAGGSEAGTSEGGGASELAGCLSYTGSPCDIGATPSTNAGSSAPGALGGLSDVSLSSAAKNAGGTDGRGAGGIELGLWYTVQSLPSGRRVIGALRRNRGVYEGNAVQVTDQPRTRASRRCHRIDDFGVVRLAIEVLRRWRFSELFHGDTLGARVAFHLWRGVRRAAPKHQN